MELPRQFMTDADIGWVGCAAARRPSCDYGTAVRNVRHMKSLGIELVQ